MEECYTYIYLNRNKLTKILWKDCPDDVIVYGLSQEHESQFKEYKAAKEICSKSYSSRMS